jgi:hypothetical protein
MALRTHAAMSAASLVVAGVGASLLLVQPHGDSNAAALHLASSPRGAPAACEPKQSLQPIKLDIDGETLSLPVIRILRPESKGDDP